MKASLVLCLCLVSFPFSAQNLKLKDPDSLEYLNASGLSFIELLPDTPGRYYVWVRAFSPGTEDNGLHAGLDGEWPESGQRMQWCEGKDQWTWESRQRTEENHCGEGKKIFLDIEKAGRHILMFSMREDGFAFDRWQLSLGYTRPGD